MSRKTLSEKIPAIREDLSAAALNDDEFQRSVRVAAIICSVLETLGYKPALIGEMAVEFYTGGQVFSEAITIASSFTQEIDEAMKALGFIFQEKCYIERSLGIHVKFSGTDLEEGNQLEKADIDGYPLFIVSKEDLVIELLEAFKYGQDIPRLGNAYALIELYHRELAQQRMISRARRKDVQNILNEILEWVREKKVPTESDVEKLYWDSQN